MPNRMDTINSQLIEASCTIYQLTEEQKQCVEVARQGKDLKIKAFAGSGKTSTLLAIAKELSGKGLYLAYNKAIQTDAARKFPLHVDCKTAHSIAYRVLAYRIKDRVRTLSIFDITRYVDCLLYTSPSPRDRQKSRMPSSA